MKLKNDPPDFFKFLQEPMTYFRDATTSKTSVFAGYFSKVPVTSFHEGKAKKAKPAKTVFLAHTPANFVLVTDTFIVQFLKTTKTLILLNENTEI